MKTYYLKWLTAFILALAFWAGWTALRPSPTLAQGPITVTTTIDELNNDGDCSLREAVQAANTNSAVDNCPAGSGADTVVLPPGTYVLNSGAWQLNLTSTLTLSPTGSLTNTIIDGGGATNLFEIRNGGGVVTITNVTLQNGTTTGNGGAIWHIEGGLLLSRVVITGNTAGLASTAAGLWFPGPAC